MVYPRFKNWSYLCYQKLSFWTPSIISLFLHSTALYTLYYCSKVCDHFEMLISMETHMKLVWIGNIASVRVRNNDFNGNDKLAIGFSSGDCAGHSITIRILADCLFFKYCWHILDPCFVSLSFCRIELSPIKYCQQGLAWHCKTCDNVLYLRSLWLCELSEHPRLQCAPAHKYHFLFCVFSFKCCIIFGVFTESGQKLAFLQLLVVVTGLVSVMLLLFWLKVTQEWRGVAHWFFFFFFFNYFYFDWLSCGKWLVSTNFDKRLDGTRAEDFFTDHQSHVWLSGSYLFNMRNCLLLLFSNKLYAAWWHDISWFFFVYFSKGWTWLFNTYRFITFIPIIKSWNAPPSSLEPWWEESSPHDRSSRTLHSLPDSHSEW